MEREGRSTWMGSPPPGKRPRMSEWLPLRRELLQLDHIAPTTMSAVPSVFLRRDYFRRGAYTKVQPDKILTATSALVVVASAPLKRSFPARSPSVRPDCPGPGALSSAPVASGRRRIVFDADLRHGDDHHAYQHRADRDVRHGRAPEHRSFVSPWRFSCANLQIRSASRIEGPRWNRDGEIVWCPRRGDADPGFDGGIALFFW